MCVDCGEDEAKDHWLQCTAKERHRRICGITEVGDLCDDAIPGRVSGTRVAIMGKKPKLNLFICQILPSPQQQQQHLLWPAST